MVRGTTGWKQYSLVLDVPVDAQTLSYGALLLSRGQVWIDDATFEEVGKDVPESADQSAIRQGIDAEFAKLPPEVKASVIENGKRGMAMSALDPANLEFE